MHKDLKDLIMISSERSETKMAALGGDDERLDPSTRVLTVLARIPERGCQTLFIRSITTWIIERLVYLLSMITTKNVYKLIRE